MKGGTHRERTNERTNERTRWLPADLHRELAVIAEREQLTVRELVLVAVRELVAAYQAPQRASDRVAAARPQVDETLETVWTPHRSAPSLLGDRRSKAS